MNTIAKTNISFDLNPLTSIEVAAKLLDDDDTPPTLREELVGIILKECNHLSVNIASMIQQYDDAPGPSTGEAEIASLIDAAVSESEFILSGRGIAVRTEVAHDLPAIECNSDQIRKLFVSLIVIAAQPEVAGTTVILDAHRGQNGVVLDVTARGPFARRVASRLFGSHPGSSSVYLAAAQDIVRRHGGRITGIGNLGKGLEFSVWLPLHLNNNNGGRHSSDSGGRREP
jgi:signal transduction histidine kinase